MFHTYLIITIKLTKHNEHVQRSHDQNENKTGFLQSDDISDIKDLNN